MNHRVFISYTQSDQELVRELRTDLDEMGNGVFFDEELTGGQSWRSTLLEQIRGCDVFMPVVGDSWLDSEPCKRDTDYAHKLGKEFIPLVLGSTPPRLLPPPIAETHWIRYEAGSKQSLMSLMKAMASVSPNPDPPLPLPKEPSVPISYLTELRERVQVDHDISRDQQALIISEVRRHLITGKDDQEMRIVLNEFRNRRDLSADARDEIDQILPTITPAEQESSAAPMAAFQPVPPSPSLDRPPDDSPVPANSLAQNANNSKIVWSYVSSVIAVFILPPVFGGLAAWLAYSEKKSGNPKGQSALAVAAVATVVGFIFGILFYSGL